MNITELCSDVKNIESYIKITNDIINKDFELQLNMGTILALKNIRFYEILYFDIKNSPGAASIILARLLKLPSNARSWRVIGKEVVDTLHFWLSSCQGNFKFKNNAQRCNFLKVLLRHINDVAQKHEHIANILVQETAECLFAISTEDAIQPRQRHELLHCLNKFCAHSDRELRISLERKLQHYFVKLGAILCRSVYLPGQQAALEALLRWMMDRHSLTCRAAAADLWLPGGVCPEPARRLFVETKWNAFYSDARSFLNTLNENVGLITSVLCKKLTIGEVVIINGDERYRSWMDINDAHSVSVTLQPKVMERCVPTHFDASEAITIEQGDVDTVTLTSVGGQIHLVLRALSPPRLTPSGHRLGDSCDVTVLLAHNIPLAKLDDALRKVFTDKYQTQIDLNEVIPLSPRWSQESARAIYNSEEETRFSFPRKLSCGEAVSGVCRNGLASHPTDSSSPSQLQEKLEALPVYPFDKRKKIIVHPKLSSVIERNEDYRSFTSLSTYKIKRSGVCVGTKQLRKTAVSDDERQKRVYRQPSPIMSNDDFTSCLLVATIGSANDSVINDTRERLSRNNNYKDEEIIDLLMREALVDQNTAIASNDANTDQNKQTEWTESNNEVIENTPTLVHADNTKNKNDNNKICTVISATDDESNTDAICNTPVFSSVTKHKEISKILKVNITKLKLTTMDKNADGTTKKPNEIPDNTYKESNKSKAISDNEHIESNFTANVIPDTYKESTQTILTSNKQQIIDPGVKDSSENRKINNKKEEVPNKEVTPSVNVIGKKTKRVNKSTASKKAKRGKAGLKINIDSSVQRRKQLTKENENILENTNIEAPTPEKTPEKVILNFTLGVGDKPRASKRVAKKNIKTTKKLEKQIQSKTSHENKMLNSIVEDANITIEDDFVAKRKRKLYSPEDHELRERKIMCMPQSEEDDVPLSKYNYNTNKTITTDCIYADWKTDTQNNTKKRNKKKTPKINKKIPTLKPPSPRTLKLNDAFEKAKNLASNEKVTLLDKNANMEIYNFTSESEGDDFVSNKKNVKKSTTPVSRTTRTALYGKRKKINYFELSSNDENKKENNSKRTKVTKRANKNTSVLRAVLDTDLVDERMRESNKEVLNTSIIVDRGQKEHISPKHDTPNIRAAPQMEVIVDEPQKTRKKPKKTNKLALIKNGHKFDTESNKTTSPLPGLVIETVPDKTSNKDSINDSKMKRLLKAFCEKAEGIDNTFDTQLILDETSVNCNDEIVSINYNEENLAGDKCQVNKRLQRDIAKPGKGNNSNKTTHKSVNGNSIGSRKQSELNIITKPYLSIDSDDINAHGDLEEAPPTPEMIRKSMHSRDLVDMDNTIKGYYVALNRVINESPKPANTAAMMTRLSENGSSPRPVVSIERLSINDYLRYLPSRRSFDSEPSSVMDVTTIAEIHNEPRKHGRSKHVKTTNDFETLKSSAPKSVTDKTQSNEDLDEILEIPGSPKSNKTKTDSQISRHGYSTRQKRRLLPVSPVMNRKRVTKQTKRAKLMTSNSKNTSKDTSPLRTQSTVDKRTQSTVDKLRNDSDKTAEGKDKTSSNRSDSDGNVEKAKKISISPVRSFGHAAKDQIDSDGDEYVQKYRNIFSKPISKIVEVTNKLSNTAPKDREIEIFQDIDLHTAGDVENASESEERFSSIVKRIEERTDGKDRGWNEADTASGRSVVSVKEWLRRLDVPTSEESDPSHLFKDVMEGVLEKLDTVLNEMNHTTSKKFVNLCVDAQIQWNAERERLQRACADIATASEARIAAFATDIATHVANMAHTLTAEGQKDIDRLKRRCQEMDKFLDELKDKSTEVVKQDKDQKRAMVLLLKQDFQAVADHMDRIRNKP